MTYRMIPGMQQIETAPAAFLHLFGVSQPERIVEIGCGSGLWTMCLAALAGPRVRIYGYDTREMLRPAIPSVIFRVADCWEVDEEIRGLIRKPGTTLLLCDGGNKVREFNRFAHLLKSGDVIAAHDYSPSRKEFVDVTRPLVWDHCEITDNKISETIKECCLAPFCHESMQEALWGCWRRR